MTDTFESYSHILKLLFSWKIFSCLPGWSPLSVNERYWTAMKRCFLLAWQIETRALQYSVHRWCSCLEKSEVVTGNRNFNSFKKKQLLMAHADKKLVCNVCSEAESQTHRLTLGFLTKRGMTENIVTAFKNLHICLVYPMLGNHWLEAMTHWSAWVYLWKADE